MNNYQVVECVDGYAVEWVGQPVPIYTHRDRFFPKADGWNRKLVEDAIRILRFDR